MLIGIPKEVKDHEYRVGATPAFVSVLIQNDHEVIIQKDAGAKIGFMDEMYEQVGAKIVSTLEEAYRAEMIIKVKEPQDIEFPFMHEGQILFCYLHLAPDLKQTQNLLEQKVIGIAYETIEDIDGKLPLLAPMSEVAGRVAIQAGAYALQMANGGRGMLLGGVAGVLPANVVVLGGGYVGTEAARMALGLGADVTILDIDLKRLRELDELYSPRLKTLYSNPLHLQESIEKADLLIGAVLVHGGKAPSLVTRDMLKTMKKGSVIVDVAVDQGGCIETSRPTTHSNPTYVIDGVVHYCVTNMPGAVARTSTEALTNATLPYALKIANEGAEKALLSNDQILKGLNVYKGKVTLKPVAKDLGFEYTDPKSLLSEVELTVNG
ncbi:MAG: Alanine dehydrogenase 2 [Chlamydiae bacterium]|nr:Alanine dehydrogenase 2 [Chlamydiota bacterium]